MCMINYLNKSFGNKIRDLREDMDMSQSQIAALIPMNQSNYSKIERDLQEPDLHQLKRIAEILCVSCDELLEINNRQTDDAKTLIFAKRVIELYESLFKKP